MIATVLFLGCKDPTPHGQVHSGSGWGALHGHLWAGLGGTQPLTEGSRAGLAVGGCAAGLTGALGSPEADVTDAGTLLFPEPAMHALHAAPHCQDGGRGMCTAANPSKNTRPGLLCALWHL